MHVAICKEWGMCVDETKVLLSNNLMNRFYSNFVIFLEDLIYYRIFYIYFTNMIINIKLKYFYKIYHVHFLGTASACNYISVKETMSLKDLKYFYIVLQELSQINF